MNRKFTIDYKQKRYNFELDDKGYVWLIQEDKIPNKTNCNQIKTVSNLNEAKDVAKEMLYTMGI